MKNSSLKSVLFLCLILVNFKSYGQDDIMVIEETTIEDVTDWESELSFAESQAYEEITEGIIKYCYDFSAINFEGKYQMILSELKNSAEYRSPYDKLLIIVDSRDGERAIKEARKAYESSRKGAPNQIRYWVKVNEDRTIDFEYRHTLK